MKDNKSPGVDGILPKLLLAIVEKISIPLATVFNLSLEEGKLPLEWKEANIRPLFKKGSRNKSENNRPVSFNSCELTLTKILLQLIGMRPHINAVKIVNLYELHLLLIKVFFQISDTRLDVC